MREAIADRRATLEPSAQLAAIQATDPEKVAHAHEILDEMGDARTNYDIVLIGTGNLSFAGRSPSMTKRARREKSSGRQPSMPCSIGSLKARVHFSTHSRQGKRTAEAPPMLSR